MDLKSKNGQDETIIRLSAQSVNEASSQTSGGIKQPAVTPLICDINMEKGKTGKEMSKNSAESKNEKSLLKDSCNSVEEGENTVKFTLSEVQHKDDGRKEVLQCTALAELTGRNKETNMVNLDQDNFMIEIDKDISDILTEIEKDNADKMKTVANIEQKVQKPKTSCNIESVEPNRTHTSSGLENFKDANVDSDPDVIFISAHTSDDIISLSDISSDSDIEVFTNEAIQVNKNNSSGSTERTATLSSTVNHRKDVQKNFSEKIPERKSCDIRESIVSKFNTNLYQKQTKTKYLKKPLTNNIEMASNVQNNAEKTNSSNYPKNEAQPKNFPSPALKQYQLKVSRTAREQNKNHNSVELPTVNKLTAQNLQNNITPKVKISKSVENWLDKTSQLLINPLSNALNNNVSKQIKPETANNLQVPPTSLYTVKIMGQNKDVILPIDYSIIPKVRCTKNCIDVTLNSKGEHESYRKKEKRFIRFKISEGWSIEQAQRVVKMTRDLKKMSNEDSLKEMPPLKKQKLNEVDASYVASDKVDSTISVNTNNQQNITRTELCAINAASFSKINSTQTNPSNNSKLTSDSSKIISNSVSDNSKVRTELFAISNTGKKNLYINPFNMASAGNVNIPVKTTGQQNTKLISAATPDISTNLTIYPSLTSNNSMVPIQATSENATPKSIVSAKKECYQRDLSQFIKRELNIEEEKKEDSQYENKIGYLREASKETGKGNTQNQILSQTKETQTCTPFVSNQTNLQAESKPTLNFQESCKGDFYDLTNHTSAASCHVQTQLNNTQSQIQSDQLKVAIVHTKHPIKNLSKTKTEEIKKSVLAEVDKAENINDNLGFLGCNYKDGGLVLICINDETKHWLIRTIKTLDPFPKNTLKIIEERFLKSYLCLTHIPAEDKLPFNQFLLRLERQNVGLSTKNWQLIKTFKMENGENLQFTVDESTKKIIINQKGKLCLNFGQISIKMRENNGRTNIFTKPSSKRHIDNNANIDVSPSTTSTDNRNSQNRSTVEFSPVPNLSTGKVNKVNNLSSFLQSNSSNTVQAAIMPVQNSNRNTIIHPIQTPVSKNRKRKRKQRTGNGMYSNNYPQNMVYNNLNRLNMNDVQFNPSSFGFNPRNLMQGNPTLQYNNIGLTSGFRPTTNELHNNNVAMGNSMIWY